MVQWGLSEGQDGSPWTWREFLRTEDSGEESEWKGAPMAGRARRQTWAHTEGVTVGSGLIRHSDVLYIRECCLYCLRYGV